MVTKKAAKIMGAKDGRFTEITDLIVASLEQGATPWHWVNTLPVGAPMNAKSRKFYTGANQLWLQLMAEVRGFEGIYATYNTWDELGCQVRLGELGEPAVRWAVDKYGDTVPRWFRLHDISQVDSEIDGKIDVIRQRCIGASFMGRPESERIELSAALEDELVDDPGLMGDLAVAMIRGRLGLPMAGDVDLELWMTSIRAGSRGLFTCAADASLLAECTYRDHDLARPTIGLDEMDGVELGTPVDMDMVELCPA